MTTSPGGEEGSGFGSLGVGSHLLAIPVLVLNKDKKIVARRAILEMSIYPESEHLRTEFVLPILVFECQTEESSTHGEAEIGQKRQRAIPLDGRSGLGVVFHHANAFDSVGRQFVAAM
jgi:hypothetical protein